MSIIENKTKKTKKQIEEENKEFEKGRIEITNEIKNKLIDTVGYFAQDKNRTVMGYAWQDFYNAFERPYHKNNWRIILDLSEYYMNQSPHYYRLVKHYSNMALFHWTVTPIDIKSDDQKVIDLLTKKYKSLISKLDSMNLDWEFKKIMNVLPYKDIYFGLLCESNKYFFIQEVDYHICRISQILDGLYVYQINLSSIRNNLTAYPDYVQEAFFKWDDFNKGLSTDGYVDMWYTPPLKYQICIKMNWEYTYPMPLLANIVKDIDTLDVYKNLKLQSARVDNYKAIAFTIPIKEDRPDNALVTLPTVENMAQINSEALLDDIGVIHSYGEEAKAISFKESSNVRNNVDDGVEEIYNDAGVTRQVFNGGTTATAIKVSLEEDAGTIYTVYEQLETWVNRWIKLQGSNKYNSANFKFRFDLIRATIFNKDDVLRRYKDNMAMGFPVVDKILSMLNINPSKIEGAMLVNNGIFDFSNNFKPLRTSYNSSDKLLEEASGRPTNEDRDIPLSDDGEDTQDRDTNIDRDL